MVRRLVDTAFGGSAEGLVMALLHDRGVSKEEAKRDQEDDRSRGGQDIMNLLASLDPGDAVTGLVVIILLQTSVVIVMASLWSGTFLRRRAEGRHALWLGVLILIVVSPVLAGVARQSNFWLLGNYFANDGRQGASQLRKTRSPDSDVSRSDSSQLPVDSSAITVPANSEPVPEVMAMRDIEPARSVRRQRQPANWQGAAPSRAV